MFKGKELFTFLNASLEQISRRMGAVWILATGPSRGINMMT